MAYKNNALDDIIKCNVEISNPASNDATFDTILMITAPASATGKKTVKKVTSISSADELLEYGYKVTDPAYLGATCAFSQALSPSNILVCVREKTKESASEDLKITLNRAKSEAGFYGIYLAGFNDPNDIKSVMEWTEANEKIFGFEITDKEQNPIKNSNYYRTFAIFSGNAEGYLVGELPDTNRYAAIAWMARCFGYQPGTETWALKSLATIVPSALDASEKKEFADNKINTFLRYAGDNVTIGGYMVSGEWIDVIRFRDWLKNEMQVRVFNVLKVNRKVPFTDEGITLIQGAMEETLKKGQILGGIAPTQYGEDDKVIPGYQVTVPLASDFTEGERKARKLTGCKYTARLAGAIHAVTIEGYLSF